MMSIASFFLIDRLGVVSYERCRSAIILLIESVRQLKLLCSSCKSSRRISINRCDSKLI